MFRFEWLKEFPWLYYFPSEDAAYCLLVFCLAIRIREKRQ